MFPIRVGCAASLAVVLLLPAEVRPCSICRCGDPTFNALGKDGFAAKGFRAAVDWERFDKEEGPPEGESEALVENRLTALLSYGFSERATLFARVPVSIRDFTERDDGEELESFTTSGLSDPELYGQVRLWASPLRGGLGRRASLSLLGGVKTALGRNDIEREGERVDEHAQPGTGSTDLFGGVSFLYLLDKRSALFSSVQYRHPGENDFEYRYGSIFLTNLAYERKLGGRVDLVAELNYRWAGRDRESVEGELPNTGGSIVYLTPRLLVDLGAGIVLRGAAQIPLHKDLNGSQKELAVLNVGLTFVWNREGLVTEQGRAAGPPPVSKLRDSHHVAGPGLRRS